MTGAHPVTVAPLIYIYIVYMCLDSVLSIAVFEIDAFFLKL